MEIFGAGFFENLFAAKIEVYCIYVVFQFLLVIDNIISIYR